MKPSRPYLLRAFYDWIVANDLTPYLVISADMPGVYVPREFVEEGRIVLNVAPGAVRGLKLNNDHIEFNARFGGVPFDIYAPIRAVSAVYAKENGRGMVFKDEEDFPPEGDGASGSGKKEETDRNGGKGKGGKGKGRAKLTVVK